jgi:hypothetical protein
LHQQNYSVVTRDNKLNDGVTRFFISAIFKVLVVSKAMVADESPVKIPELSKLKPNLVPTSTKVGETNFVSFIPPIAGP